MTFATLPLALDAWYVPLLLGVLFGFTLEASGFGDARRLAAQFYFRESRVVKVMFTAIVTAMLLLLWASALGVLDLDALWVNPTYLASGILGGVVLGVGFIVGGYCPGTSIVSAATLKKDGALFLLGVGLGSLAFSETADSFRTWYDDAGYLGRVTLPEWLGLPAGVVAVLVVLLALGMFAAFDRLESSIGRRAAAGGAEPRPAPRGPGSWRPAAKGALAALAVFLLAALALPVAGQPTLEDRLAREAPALDRALEARAPHVDAVEVLGLMHNHVQGSLGRFRLLLVDVRDESDYNRFHLVDAVRLPLQDLRGDGGRALARAEWKTAIKVVMSNDEERAEAAWRILSAQGVKDVYVLAGGMNAWIDRFQLGLDPAARRPPPGEDDVLRHPFVDALGDRYDAARPSLPVFEGLRDAPGRAWKVAPVVQGPKPSGGCG